MRNRLITATAAACAGAAVVLSPTAAEAASAIQIYRVYYDSPGKDTGSNSSLNAEWVQLKNKGANTSANRYWGRSWYVWNNTGDTAYLRTPGGSLADSCRWGAKGDYKYC